jgi:hypothetical protein
MASQRPKATTVSLIVRSCAASARTWIAALSSALSPGAALSALRPESGGFGQGYAYRPSAGLAETALAQGVAVIMRSITVRLVEGRIAEDLAAIQKAHPAVSIGSYPFFADAGGPAGTTLVIRGRDGREVEMAEHEILQLALSLGVTPEKTGDSR